ncbi:MAG: class I SAM-dependent methyltransferase [Chloroflexi bacterium]|nr:class I SAM-dependent methyltransferase [Chloroflexota bacterium]
MQLHDYTAANRRAWNQAAPVHAQHNFDSLRANFARPGYACLDAIATDILRGIGVAGKSVAQLCCNNGRELLSIKNLGAARCVGFDIADDFIAQARALASAGKIECEFVAGDVYDIPRAYAAQFDLVFISIGALGWLPNIEKFFEIVASLLRADGTLFIYEQHPITVMFDEADKSDLPPRLHYSYFLDAPFADDGGLDYYGGTRYESLIKYWFHHKLSDIVQAILDQGLTLKAFREYPHDISNLFAHVEKMEIKLPLCYTLIAQKESTVTE